MTHPLEILKNIPRWFVWTLRWNEVACKFDKTPHMWRGGHRAPVSWIWETHAKATARLDALRNGGAQVTLGFNLGDQGVPGFIFIDIDHCIQNGALSQAATRIAERFIGAAWEVSTSGTGIHIFCKAQIPDELPGGMKPAGAGFELYTRQRGIAFGWDFDKGILGDANIDATSGLSWLIETFDLLRTRPIARPIAWTTAPIPEWSGTVDDAQLIGEFIAEPIRPSRDAAVVFGGRDDASISNESLWRSDVAALSSAFPPDKPGEPYDRSRADFALAIRLAWWTGKHCDRIERLMRASALARDKWNEPWGNGFTRLQHDIVNACGYVNTVRKPPILPVLSPESVTTQAVTKLMEHYSSQIYEAGDVINLEYIARQIGQEHALTLAMRKTLGAAVFQRSCILLGTSKGWGLKHCEMLCYPSKEASNLDRSVMREELQQMGVEYDATPPLVTLDELIRDAVYITHGKMVARLSIADNAHTLDEFSKTYAASRMLIGEGGETASVVDVWLKSQLRKTVSTRTFRAGAPIITQSPRGEIAYNLWRPVIRTPSARDITPFLDHVRYLFEDSADKFLDWLAHIEQHPGVLPHSGWLHIAKHFGTGRGALSQILANVWRGYVVPNLDLPKLLSSSYNGVLAGSVLAVVDEVREGGRDDSWITEQRIRSILTAQERTINPKFAAEYQEYNAMRWLICSNHEDALPIQDTDRRWHIVNMKSAPRPDDVYVQLYALANDKEWINSVGVWLAQRDIRHFNPGERPINNIARVEIVSSTRSNIRQSAEDIMRYWPSDLISWQDIENIMADGQPNAKPNSAAIRHAIRDAGMRPRTNPVRDSHKKLVKVWIVRNIHIWADSRNQTHDAGIEMLRAAREFGVSAYSKLLEAMPQ